MSWVEQQYQQFYEKNGYYPTFFKPHDILEIKDVCPTITTSSGRTGGGRQYLNLTDRGK